MKDEEIKCNCGAETTGWTTIACCNLCGLPIPNEPFSVNKQMLVNRFERIVMPKIAVWQKEKPNKPCLMVTRTYYDGYNYQLFELNYIENYLAVICEDGEEWGALEDLSADEYYVIEYYNSNFSE